MPKKNVLIKQAMHFITLVLLLCAMSNAQTTFNLRGDGTILKNGQAIFPMGFYLDRNSVDAYKNQVTTIADAGAFNVVNLPYGQGDWNSFLDLCASKNIYVVSQLDYLGDFTGVIPLYKNHAAIYGWSVADDADNGYFSTGQLADRNSQIKNADANHITETSLTGYYYSRRQAADNYTSIPDVSCYQCYPITPPGDYDVTPGNALTETYLRTLGYVLSAAKVHRPMIMNTQYFSWGDQSPNPRFPTAAEVRNMTYSGLAAGIKGIIGFVFSYDLVNQIAEWNEIKTIRTDVTTLESALLDGTLTRVNTGDQELVSSYWTYNNNCYVVVVNTSYGSSKNVSIALPGGYIGVKTSLFPRMPNTLSVSGGSLTGSIAAQEVEVYRISKNQSSDTQAPSVPSGLASPSITETSFTLSWTASTDNVGVTGYEVFKDGASIGTTATTSMSITGIDCGTAYSMTVKAGDDAGNTSAASTALSVATSACAPGTEITVNDNSARIAYTGSWTSGTYNTNPGNINQDEHLTNATNDAASFTFTGTNISWIGTASGNRGIVDVYIDNTKVASIDVYAASFAFQKVLYTNASLSSGSHTIKLMNTGTKNASSSGTYLIVDAFKYNNPGTTRTIGSRYLKSFQQQFAFVTAKGMITINLTSAGFTRVRISDANGRLVYSTSAAGKLIMPTSAIKPGVYFVSEQCDGLTRAHKVAISQ